MLVILPPPVPSVISGAPHEFERVQSLDLLVSEAAATQIGTPLPERLRYRHFAVAVQIVILSQLLDACIKCYGGTTVTLLLHVY